MENAQKKKKPGEGLCGRKSYKRKEMKHRGVFIIRIR